MPSEKPLRILVATRGLHWDRDEGTDVRQLITALVGVAHASPDVEVLATDLRRGYRSAVIDGRLTLELAGPLIRHLRKVDVVYLHYGFDPHNVLFGALVKLLRIPLVLEAESVLTDSFMSESWYAGRGRAALRMKGVVVRWMRRHWSAVASLIVCSSDHEVQTSHLSEAKTVLLPLPTPLSDLAETAAEAPHSTSIGTPGGPVAFVSRMDVQRKGIDRMVIWLSAYAEALPRPAVILFTDADQAAPDRLEDLVRAGVVEWRPDLRGRDMLPLLRECRGAILLSRWDGYPRALREAALLGLPVLCTPSSHFGETIEALGTGAVVDGDDPADVQRGFESLAVDPASAMAARQVLAPENIGRYLLQVLTSTAGGSSPAERSYYRWIAGVVTR